MGPGFGKCEVSGAGTAQKAGHGRTGDHGRLEPLLRLGTSINRLLEGGGVTSLFGNLEADMERELLNMGE